MLDLMPSKKINKSKKDEVESNLILFGLILVLILSLVTFWHVSYKKNKSQNTNVSSFVEETAIKEADLNQDGKVDEKDAKLMKQAFLKNDNESLKADLNQDGKVDAKDYSLFNKIVNLKEKDANVTK